MLHVKFALFLYCMCWCANSRDSLHLFAPLLPVTFAWVAGSELLLMSRAFSLWIILPSHLHFSCHITLIQVSSQVLILGFYKKALAQGIYEHGISPLSTCRNALPCLFCIFCSPPNSLPLAPYFCSLITHIFLPILFFLRSCYIISTGFYLQSQPVYLGIFLNKIMS